MQQHAMITSEPGAEAHQEAALRAARPALLRFATVSVVLGLCWLLPYAHPSLESWRYYDSFDASPLVRAATMQAPAAAGAAAMGGLAGLGAGDGGVDQPSDDELAALDDGLGAAVAGNEAGGADAPGGPDEAEDPALLAAAGEPTPDPGAASEAGAQAAGSADKSGPAGAAATTAPGTAVAPAPAPATAAAAANGAGPDHAPAGAAALDATGVGTPPAAIEHPERLQPFFAALADLAHGRRTKVRARHYGDSHLANDGISHVLRVLLQRRFGDGGHGFVLAASRSKWYSHKGVRIESSDDWKSRSYLGGGFGDNAYGYGGEGSQGAAGASAKVSTGAKGHGARAERIELWWRGGGDSELAVELDGQKVAPIKAKDGVDTRSSWGKLADAGHRVRVRVVHGRPKLYGWVLERERGIVWDSLGIVGARARRWLGSDAAHVAAQVRERDTQLLVLNYGANSRLDKISEAKYADSFLQVIQRLRPNPNEACLILGPGDHGKREKGQIVSEQRTVEIIGWQRKVADRAGCAFFDVRRAMGGDGSMGRWVAEGLGWADYAHLTPRGQATLGKALFQALMQGMAKQTKP